MLEHAAHLVVPTLADHCVVYLPAADGTLHATSLAHSDPARAPVLAEFRQHKIPPAGPMSIQLAYSTGTSQLLRDAKAQLPQWHDLAPGLAELLVRLRADSVLSTPLLVDERPIGVLALARDAERPGFTDTDIAVVEEFARRLADGLATADTFAREHAIAETLQRSVLPGTLPSIGRLDLAVCYLPATEGADVGGDWYDAFPLDGSRVGLVIGDVTGHSIGSASIMGQVRSMLRAYAIDYPSPGEVLAADQHRPVPAAARSARHRRVRRSRPGHRRAGLRQRRAPAPARRHRRRPGRVPRRGGRPHARRLPRRGLHHRRNGGCPPGASCSTTPTG